MELTDALQRFIAPVMRIIRTMFTRAVVNLVDADTLMQTVQVTGLGGEVLDKLEHWEPYGFTSNPQPGAEALVAALGGNRDHNVAVCVADRRFRLKGLQSGEVALATDEGDVIHFRRGNQLLVDTLGTLTANAGTAANVTAPTITLTGATTVNGTLAVTGNITGAAEISDGTGTMQSMRGTYNGHTHTDPQGGTVPAPPQQM